MLYNLQTVTVIFSFMMTALTLAVNIIVMLCVLLTVSNKPEHELWQRSKGAIIEQ